MRGQETCSLWSLCRSWTQRFHKKMTRRWNFLIKIDLSEFTVCVPLGCFLHFWFSQVLDGNFLDTHLRVSPSDLWIIDRPTATASVGCQIQKYTSADLPWSRCQLFSINNKNWNLISNKLNWWKQQCSKVQQSGPHSAKKRWLLEWGLNFWVCAPLVAPKCRPIGCHREVQVNCVGNILRLNTFETPPFVNPGCMTIIEQLQKQWTHTGIACSR